jgi:hypothetical protein
VRREPYRRVERPRFPDRHGNWRYETPGGPGRKNEVPHHLIFRGEWAEKLVFEGLEEGDLMGARFCSVPWDPVTLTELARSCPQGAIPVLGEGEGVEIFCRARDGWLDPAGRGGRGDVKGDCR